MRKLKEVVESKEQKAVEYWQSASDIIENNRRFLTRISSHNNESHMLVTPSYEVRVGDKSEHFAIGAAVSEKEGYKKGNPLYLIITYYLYAWQEI